MKRIWKKIKVAWWEFWGIYEDDDDTIQHLSRSDKINIWFGSFIMCMLTVDICVLSIGINNIRNNRHYEQDMNESLNMIATYFATATEDEYDEIAQTIRHDLVFSEYGRDMKNLIQYIPNTSKDCPTCRESYPAQAFLVCVNTGETYSLDVYHMDENPDDEYGGMRLSFGYDEISEANIHVTTYPGEQYGYAEIYRGRRIVSAHKMKSVFCDDCIREILNTIDGQLVEEVVLFDAEQKAFYPVKDEETLQIGSYGLAVSYDSGDYRIDIEYVSE